MPIRISWIQLNKARVVAILTPTFSARAASFFRHFFPAIQQSNPKPPSPLPKAFVPDFGFAVFHLAYNDPSRRGRRFAGGCIAATRLAVKAFGERGKSCRC
jgi:hypothetical protein